MKITVIIPTYKPLAYLRDCIDSLDRQTFGKDSFEVLIILNGSEQPYRSEIEEYLHANAPELDAKVIYTSACGVSNARNIGLDMAAGEYVAFIDDDDYISPTYLEELYSKADKDTVSICNIQVFDDRTGRISKDRMNEVFDMLAPHGRTSLKESRRLFFTVWMKMIPMSVIGQRRFDRSLAIGEDCLFMFLVSDRIRHVDFTSGDAVYYRRVRSGSAMDSFRGSGKRKIANGLELIAKYTWIWLKGLRRYSFHFYLTRVRGALYSIK